MRAYIRYGNDGEPIAIFLVGLVAGQPAWRELELYFFKTWIFLQNA